MSVTISEMGLSFLIEEAVFERLSLTFVDFGRVVLTFVRSVRPPFMSTLRLPALKVRLSLSSI